MGPEEPNDDYDHEEYLLEDVELSFKMHGGQYDSYARDVKQHGFDSLEEFARKVFFREIHTFLADPDSYFDDDESGGVTVTHI